MIRIVILMSLIMGSVTAEEPQAIQEIRAIRDRLQNKEYPERNADLNKWFALNVELVESGEYFSRNIGGLKIGSDSTTGDPVSSHALERVFELLRDNPSWHWHIPSEYEPSELAEPSSTTDISYDLVGVFTKDELRAIYRLYLDLGVKPADISVRIDGPEVESLLFVNDPTGR